MVWPWEADVSLELWGSRVEDMQSEHIPAGVLAPGVSAVRSGRKKQQHYSSQLALLLCLGGTYTVHIPCRTIQSCCYRSSHLIVPWLLRFQDSRLVDFTKILKRTQKSRCRLRLKFQKGFHLIRTTILSQSNEFWGRVL